MPNSSLPNLKTESENFAWTVVAMGGLQAKIVPVREDMRIRFFGGRRDITQQIASFVRRGFIQVNVTSGNKLVVVRPGEPGWIAPQIIDSGSMMKVGRKTIYEIKTDTQAD